MLSWEWDGGEGPGGGSGCGCFSEREWDEGRGSPVGTVHTWPSPPLSPVNQAPYPCPYTLYKLFPALYAVT